MSIRVRIPHALCAKANGKTHLAVTAADVGEALRQLARVCPELVPLVWNDRGLLRPQVNIYVNDVHVRYLDGTGTLLGDGDEVYVVPLVMGG
jgi:molybdopterin converting factor small subunit